MLRITTLELERVFKSFWLSNELVKISRGRIFQDMPAFLQFGRFRVVLIGIVMSCVNVFVKCR